MGPQGSRTIRPKAPDGGAVEAPGEGLGRSLLGGGGRSRRGSRRGRTSGLSPSTRTTTVSPTPADDG